tara:strand:+ start:1382 stop:1795 length:414 start_codon:yes stop_codon:yes gene_type:complete
MFLYLLLASLAFGQEAVGIEKGEEAPFEGVLLPRSLAIEILSDEYKSQLENQTALKYANESCEAKLSFTKELSDVKINSYEQEIEYLNKALESRNKMVLRENSNLSKSFNFIGGFASGAIITIAVLWSVNSVNGIQQ